MKDFAKKVVMVQAEQWLGTNEQTERLLSEDVIMIIPSQDGSILVPTLDGNLPCRLNDYIVKDENGGYYIHEGEDFEANYDLVPEDEIKLLEVVGNEDVTDAKAPLTAKEKKALEAKKESSK